MIVPPNFKKILCIKFAKVIKFIDNILNRLHLKKLFAWVKKNQKSTAWVSTVLLSVQLYINRQYTKSVEDANKDLMVSEKTLRVSLQGLNATMDDLGIAWWKKRKVGDRFVLIALNKPYERQYGLLEIESLGKDNFQLVPEKAAKIFRRIDSTVAADWQPKFAIEPFIFPDSSEIKLFVYKWPDIERKDTIVSGLAIPLSTVIRVVDEKGNLEVIEIVSDTVANAFQDTIYRKKN